MDKALGGLSARDSIAAAAILRGASNAEAARLAGYKQPNALAPSRPAGRRVRTAVTSALDRAGATLPAASKVVAEGLKATETKHFPTLGRRNRKTGSVEIPERTMVNWGERRQNADMVLRAHGAFPKEQEQPPQDGIVHEIIEKEITLPDGSRAMQRIVRFDREEP